MEVVPLGYKDLSKVEPHPVEVPPKGYFLFVGTVKERKNVLNLVQAYGTAVRTHHVQEDLVVVGRFSPASSYGGRILTFLDTEGLTDRVKFLGSVTDQQLRFLYEQATAFVFPSQLEGFGMPVLEAMRLGIPVLTSNSSSLAEVAGDSALVIDPQDVPRMAEALHRIQSDQGLRRQLAERGKERADMFSWEKTARDILSVCQKQPSSGSAIVRGV
jgi:glycosyltransferase involved in cell wall biosynthesis